MIDQSGDETETSELWLQGFVSARRGEKMQQKGRPLKPSNALANGYLAEEEGGEAQSLEREHTVDFFTIQPNPDLC